MEWSYFVDRVCGNAMAYVSTEMLKCAWIRDTLLEVQGVQLLKLPYMERHVFSRDYIFVCRASELPEDPVKAPHDCVCVEDVPLPPAYTPESVRGNMIVVRACAKTEDLGLLLNHISFVLADDYRYYRGLERIERLRKKGTLRDAILLTERLVTNPTILLDSKGRVLAKGTQYEFINSWLRDAEKNGGLTPQQLRQIQNESVYLTLREDYYNNVKSHAWAMYHFLCIPVRLRGLEVAFLVIEMAFSAFHLSSVQLMEPISHLMAELIDRRMEENNDRSLLHSLLFLELLRATPEREAELKDRITEMHWSELAGMRLLCCRQMEDDSKFEQLRQCYPTARWTATDEFWLMLIYPGENVAQLAEEMERLGLRGGVSWCFARLMDLPYAFLQAKTALERNTAILTEYATVFAAHICTLPQAEIVHHLHPAVRVLTDYDRSHDGNLADTLEAYLSGPEQPNEAAARLFISRSTLFYRINRIRELSGVELTTGEERMNLLLSLRLWRALGQA